MSTRLAERAEPETDRTAEPAERCSGFSELRGVVRPCAAPATIKLSAGCVHEHIHNRWACEPCAEQILTSQMGCGACIKGPEGHRCILRGRVVETRD